MCAAPPWLPGVYDAAALNDDRCLMRLDRFTRTARLYQDLLAEWALRQHRYNKCDLCRILLCPKYGTRACPAARYYPEVENWWESPEVLGATKKCIPWERACTHRFGSRNHLCCLSGSGPRFDIGSQNSIYGLFHHGVQFSGSVPQWSCRFRAH